MNVIYLVDNSVAQRVHRAPEVARALGDLLHDGELGSCLPQLLEEGYSARQADEQERILRAGREAKVFLDPNESVAALALDLQTRLFRAGMGRAVGVSDLQIAATAMVHTNDQQSVTVIHYDADFEHVAEVASEFQHRWIVPRGSVD